MLFSFGEQYRIQLFGQSHGEAVGVVIEGVPSGTALDMDFITDCLSRRAPGNSELVTQRKEDDVPRILSGLFEGRATGDPICAIFDNKNNRPEDYEALRDIPRPGHGDYTAFVRSGGFNDARGGGSSSGRLTAPLVFAGAIAQELLRDMGIAVGARLLSLGGVCDDPLSDEFPTEEFVWGLRKKPMPVINDEAGMAMKERLLEVSGQGDSVGGIVECYVTGLPAGLGEPMFAGLEGHIAAAVFSIPAVKGVDFGAGFCSAYLKGSENNDGFYIDKNGNVRTRTNKCGGILGGMATGEPVIFQAAFKPTPSVALDQESVNLRTKESVRLSIKGRHDPCVALRAVPAVEAAAAIAVYDLVKRRA